MTYWELEISILTSEFSSTNCIKYQILIDSILRQECQECLTLLLHQPALCPHQILALILYWILALTASCLFNIGKKFMVTQLKHAFPLLDFFLLSRGGSYPLQFMTRPSIKWHQTSEQHWKTILDTDITEIRGDISSSQNINSSSCHTGSMKIMKPG